MRFIKFEIINYKGIRNLVLELNKQPKSKIFTLVGLNESGKTSILEAINLFQNDVPQKERHTLIPKSEKISFTGNISVAATLLVSDTDKEAVSKYAKSLGYKYIELYDKITITKKYEFKNSNFENYTMSWSYTPMSIKGKARKETKLGENDDDWHKLINYIRDNLVPKIVYYPNFLFDFPEKIYIDSLAENTKEGNTYKNIVQDILSSIRPNFTIQDQLLNRMDKADRANKEALENTLSTMSDIITKRVFTAWERLFSRGNKTIEVNHSDENVTVNVKSSTLPSTTTQEEITRYYLEFKLKEGANKFYIHERSLGFKWFFAFLLFTEFRKHRLSDSGEVLFLLDEPASNLHSTAQKKLLNTFEGLVDKSTLIYTTHSHHLINPEWLNGAYIVRNKALKYTDEFDYNVDLTDIEAILYKRFIAVYPEQKDYFQPILDTLDYQPGLLEKIPNIITTEGKNDFYTFKYINLMYLNNKYANLNFYPSTGADTNIQVISLYIAWNRSLIVLLDGDKKGLTAKNAYNNKFGKVIEDYVCTLADIDKSFANKSLEDLFDEDDKLKIAQYFDPKLSNYDKGKFNSGLQNLLFDKQKVGLSKMTMDNFKIVFDYLTLKVAKSITIE